MTQTLAIPGAIVIAGALIASAVVFSSSGAQAVNVGGVQPGGSPAEISIRGVEAGDYVRGNPEARVTIVEYSDFECPFCARLHPTLQRIVDENTDVHWVFRHFPLTSIHSRAMDASIAAECAGKLGGNDAFWNYSDALFDNQRQLGDALYTRLAAENGLDATAFAACLKDESVAARVEADTNEAVAAGGRGTPFSILTTASGKHIPFSGALPYEDVKRLVEQALAN